MDRLSATLGRLRRSLQAALRHAAERHLISMVRPYTMVSDERLVSLARLSRRVLEQGGEGDFVECGVCNGGTAAVLGSVLRDHPGPRLWLYDTFAGIPPAGDLDGAAAQAFADPLIGSMGRASEALDQVGFPPSRRIFRKGKFEDTFVDPLPRTIGLLHIDADWFDSVLLALKTFYPRVRAGGVVVLDDFGYWEGCRRALFAYCRETGLAPLLERVGDEQAYWIKGRETNRT